MPTNEAPDCPLDVGVGVGVGVGGGVGVGVGGGGALEPETVMDQLQAVLLILRLNTPESE